MKKSLLTQIIQQCRREINTHPQKNNFLHWTFIVQSNQVISVGYNRQAEPDRKYGYHANGPKWDANFRPKWHSEFDVCRRSKVCLNGLEMINVRLNKTGELRMSAPCKTCRNLLYVVGIKKIWFSHEYGWGKMAL